MRKILFNCSTNLVGGGVKNSAIFIKYVLRDPSVFWSFAISPQVSELLDKWGVDVPNAVVFSKSPAKSITARRALMTLAKESGSDCVYTMAGPSYVDFPITHIQGISNPHITHADLSDIKAVMSYSGFITYLFRSAYQRAISKKADYFVFQTESSRVGFCNRSNIDFYKTVVIPNAIDFSGFEGAKDARLVRSGEVVRILCPAAPYPHKGLGFVPRYAKSLSNLGVHNFKFILTIPKDSEIFRKIHSEARSLGVDSKIETIGPYNYTDASAIYRSSDYVFVPSLLETFSATYLEAFASRRPLIAADRSFAKDVCGDAAVYVEPLNPSDVADKIFNLIRSSELSNRIVNEGGRRLQCYDSQAIRVNRICEFLLDISQREKHV